MAETWTPVGKVTPTPKGAWSSSTSYARLDIVSNNGASYIAIQGVPAGTAITNTSYWQKFADKGDTGATGATGNGVASIVVTETSTSGSAHNYRMAITMTNGDVTNVDYTVTDGAVTSVNGRTGAVTGLAEDDGYYEDMTVGGAEQLISSTYVEDSVPYVFRTSGGSADIGDREVDEIVGGTVAWNQLLKQKTTTSFGGLTLSTGENGWTTMNGTITSVPQGNREYSNSITGLAGHVYYARLEIKGGSSTSTDNTLPRLVLGYGHSPSLSSATLTDSLKEGVTKTTQNGNTQIVAIYLGAVGDTLTNISYRYNLIDLTQMFGSAIADYIYSLEQSTTGSGVAWFKSLFPKPYYAYNAGELISVSGLSAHKMTGFNQFDIATSVSGEFVDASTGAINTASGMWRSDYIRVVGNASYCRVIGSTTSNHFVAWYDANKGFIERTQSSSTNVRTVIAPTNACYAIITKYTNTDSKDMRAEVCFNLAWDGERNGEYEPYEVHEYALDSDVTLRGMPKLDADNKLYYDGDSYASDGTVERRYGIVHPTSESDILGSITGTDGRKLCQLKKDAVPTANTDVGNVMCSVAVATTANWQYNGTNKTSVAINSAGYVLISVDGITSTEDMGTYFSTHDVYVVYELATPTTESAEPYTSPQIVDDWGTEEYVIAEQSGVAIPVGHETKYTANLKAKLEMAPNSPSGDGDYIVRQTGGINTYVPLTERIPNAPSENGNYILKCTVSGSTVTYTWESAT